MDPEQFHNIITRPLERSIPNFDSTGFESYYEDLLSISNLADEVRNLTSGKQFFQLLDVGDKKNAQILLKQHREIITLLKALYIFSTIFINEITSRAVNIMGTSFNVFLRKPKKPLLSLSTDAILPAYCVVVYRNKLIAHHDIRRLYSYSFDEKGINSSILPMSELFQISEHDTQNVRILAKQYEKSLPQIKGINNLYEQLEFLFYNIPIGNLGSISADRMEIDSIAERGGCRSMTLREIIKAVDDFAITVVDEISNNAS